MVVVDTHVIDVAQPAPAHKSVDVAGSKKSGDKKKKSKKSSASSLTSTTLRSDAAVANYNWLHNQFLASRRAEAEEDEDDDLLFSNSFSSSSSSSSLHQQYGESDSLAKSDNEYLSAFPRLYSQSSSGSCSLVLLGWIHFVAAVGVMAFTLYSVGMVRAWALLASSSVLALIAMQFIRTGSNLNPQNIKTLRFLALFYLVASLCATAANAYSLSQTPCVVGDSIYFTTVVLTCLSRAVLYGLLIAAGVVLPIFTNVFAFGLTSPHVPKSASSSDEGDHVPMSLSNVRALDVDARWSEEEPGVTLLQPTPPAPAPITSGSLRKQHSQPANSAY